MGAQVGQRKSGYYWWVCDHKHEVGKGYANVAWPAEAVAQAFADAHNEEFHQEVFA